jgi:hypothetical protein
MNKSAEVTVGHSFSFLETCLLSCMGLLLVMLGISGLWVSVHWLVNRFWHEK